jgi:hypothetical protein
VPPRWILARATRWHADRALDIGDGKTLIAAASGERWMQSGAVLTHAPTRFPEDLVAVLKGPNGAIDFIGLAALNKDPLPPVDVDEPFLFARDNGTVEKIKGPRQHDGVVFRVKDRWFLVSRTLDSEGWLDVSASTDAKGTSWDQQRVRMWTTHANITINIVDGRPAIVIIPRDAARGYIATLTLDARNVDVTAFAVPRFDRAHACSTVDAKALRAAVEIKDRMFPIDRGDSTYSSRLDTVVLSVPVTGTACVIALADNVSVVPMHDPSRSIAFLRGTQSMSCVLP